MHKIKADIADIFSSIQGEGLFIGAKQIFVRFKRCNMNCAFCDEPRDAAAKEYTPAELMAEVKFLDLSKGSHHSVSLTGGEPLLYADFLKIFLELLKKNGYKSYLETNGTLPDELSKIIDLIDIVAMDFKLPSSTGERAFWNEHQEFLRAAVDKNVFVKVVVTASTAREDIEKAITLIKKVRENIPLILQPATPLGQHDKHIEKEKLFSFLEMGLRNNLNNIRVVPQVHKLLDIK